MKELIKYLLDNLYLDFQGEITLDTVRGFLREDDGREARSFVNKLIEEKGRRRHADHPGGLLEGAHPERGSTRA